MLKTNEESIIFLTDLLTQIRQTHLTSNHNHIAVRKKIIKKEKIEFAVNYYDEFGDTSLLQLLKEIEKENPKLRKLIIEFMQENNLLIPHPNATFEYLHLQSPHYSHTITNKSYSNLAKEYNHNNWLEPFNEDAIFLETKTKHPTYHIFLDNDEKPVKFDKEKAKKVKLAIVNQGITPARCIVEAGYPYEAKENLDEYIKFVKSLRR